MKRLLALAFLIAAFASHASASISLVQKVATASGACSASSSTCSITVSSTGAGHFGEISYSAANTNSTTIASVSTGGSWTVPTGCHIHNASLGDAGCAYILSLGSGVTTITVTWSSSTPGNFCNFSFREYSYTGTAISLDSGASGGLGTINDSSSSASQSGVGLTLAGSNDAIVQSVNIFSGIPSSITTYGNFLAPASTFSASADLLNTSSGAAPTWTLSTSATAQGVAIAFTETNVKGTVIQ